MAKTVTTKKAAKMDRRTLLKTAAAGGVGVAGPLGLDGCAHVAPSGTPDEDLLGSINPADVDRYLADIDRRMAWIEKQNAAPLVPAPAEPCAPEKQAELDTFTRLFRKSARALYLTGCFLEAPEEIRAHPGMQARVHAAQGDMDEAVFGTTAMLESLTPEQHRGIRRTLQERPEVAEELARYLDAPAKQDGLPFKRRFLLRSGILDLAGRMKAQSPALVIDTYVKKVRRIEARGPAAARSDASRLLAARIGEEAFWAHQDRMSKLSTAWERKLAYVGAGTGAPPPAPAAAPPPAATPPPAVPAPAASTPPQKADPTNPTNPSIPAPPTSGQKTLSAGGYIMGYGLASIGIGLIFAGLWKLTAVEALAYPAVIMGVTVGPILLVIGLLVVIIGAISRAAE